MNTDFRPLFLLAILMVIGAALIPGLKVADGPRPRQGSTLTITCSWPGASAKVVEQNVTAQIEGLASSVRGVEDVSSESYNGSGKVVVQLKKHTDVSAAKYEIGSLLRQAAKKLPPGVSYPVIEGGEVAGGSMQRGNTRLLLTYHVSADMDNGLLKQRVADVVEPQLKRVKGVASVEVTGGEGKVMEISYDPGRLAGCGLSAADIERAVKGYRGRDEAAGEVLVTAASGNREKTALYLSTRRHPCPLEQMPVGTHDGRTVRLGDVATCAVTDRDPDTYYRVNGLSTVSLNIHAAADADMIGLSATLRDKMATICSGMNSGMLLSLAYDAAADKAHELRSVAWQTALAVALLMLFLWVVRRSWRYMLIMATTLLACLLTAVIAYRLLDVRLHTYSLAGITVSAGLVTDAAVVMADHYSYRRNRRVMPALVAALLTTICSLVVVFWLPCDLRAQLYDFACIVIVNLSVALLVSWLFVPPLVRALHYDSRQRAMVRHRRLVSLFTAAYGRYAAFVQRHRVVAVAVCVLAFGLPVQWLPERWGGDDSGVSATETAKPWYARAYDATLGSRFFQNKCKEPLATLCGGAVRLFGQALDNDKAQADDGDVHLMIRAQMPLGGTARQLNDKVLMVDRYLSAFKEIDRYETRVDKGGAVIDVSFNKQYRHTSAPMIIENKVIGRLVTIGGAQWSTSGVSARGFSSTPSLQYRANGIEIAGYQYDRLCRIADDMCRTLGRNPRVTDIAVETPGHESRADELYMAYDKERMALYGFNLSAVHHALQKTLAGYDMPDYDMPDGQDVYTEMPVHIKSAWRDSYDMWMLQHASLPVDSSDLRLASFMDVEKRGAGDCIPRRHQEYVLRVAFNIMGSYAYASHYIDSIAARCNAAMPVGYRCLEQSGGSDNGQSRPYWLIALIAVMVFGVCSSLFESVRYGMVIVALIPLSLIGTFVTYWATGVAPGTGGYAAMVLLAGLTVNAAIYILHDYASAVRRGIKPYLRAYNHKITAVVLTVLSTAVGLVPFLFAGASPFWHSFAVGTIGGLVFSVAALTLFLPIMVSEKAQNSCTICYKR